MASNGTVLAACACALVVCGVRPARGDDPNPATPPVVIAVSKAEAKPDSEVTLDVSLQASAPMAALSVALDFDESRLRVLDIRFGLNNLSDGEPIPGNSATFSFNNADETDGGQTSEGWVHLEVVAGAKEAAIGLPAASLGGSVLLAAVRFYVLPTAPPGFTPVTIGTVGPVSPVPATYFVTAVQYADDRNTWDDLSNSPAALLPGGIDIIGEVGFFMRGDANFDKGRDITDPIITLSNLFLGGASPPCLDAADSNDDGKLDISDAVHTLQLLFLVGGDFPPPEMWGQDPTPDDLGCAIYPSD